MHLPTKVKIMDQMSAMENNYVKGTLKTKCVVWHTHERKAEKKIKYKTTTKIVNGRAFVL